MTKKLEELTIAELWELIGKRMTSAEPPVSPEKRLASEPVSPARRLIPATEWNQHHSWPPPGGLRWLIFHETTNGFDQVVRRVGRRVLIDEEAIFNWVEIGTGRQGTSTSETPSRRDPRRSRPTA